MKTAVEVVFIGKERLYNRRFLQMCISIVRALNTDVFVQSTNGGANVTVSNLQSYQRSKQVAKFSLDGALSAGALYNLRLKTATAALVIDGHLA